MIADNKQMFIMCDCNSHGIVVDKIFDDDVCISLFELSLRGRKLNFSGKLRWCWQILSRGYPWTDYVILDRDKAKQLANYINELAQEN